MGRRSGRAEGNRGRWARDESGWDLGEVEELGEVEGLGEELEETVVGIDGGVRRRGGLLGLGRG